MRRERKPARVFRSRITHDWCWRCSTCAAFGTVGHRHQPVPGEAWRMAMALLHVHLISAQHAGRMEDQRAARLLAERVRG